MSLGENFWIWEKIFGLGLGKKILDSGLGRRRFFWIWEKIFGLGLGRKKNGFRISKKAKFFWIWEKNFGLGSGRKNWIPDEGEGEN